jgi:hypothetical protein
MHNAKNEDILVFDAINDDVLPDGKAPASGAEIFSAGTSDVEEAGQREKTVRDGIDQAVGNSMLPLSLAT